MHAGYGSYSVDKSVMYVDNFTMAYGSAFLCGLGMHGESGVRVHGLAPVWCWNKTEVALSE